MLIDFSEILKTSNLSDQELSNHLDIPVDQIELIKNQQLYPHQDLTRKIVQLSKQKFNSTQSTLKSDFYFGQPIKLSRVITSIIFIIFISLLFTGFGYQPFWVFLLVLSIGLLITLPSCFNNYWLIGKNGIKIIEFSTFGITKLAQLLHLTAISQKEISYQEIDHINISYQKRIRNSPFDINPDIFQLVCTLKNSQRLSIDINASLERNLPDLVIELNYQGIDVYDPEKVLLALVQKENLFQKFNPTYS